MPTRIMKVTYEAGAKLSRSRKSPGDYSPLTRDEDNNLGHVVLQPLDEGQVTREPETVFVYVDQTDGAATSRDETAETLAALLVLGVAIAIERRSDIALWWRETMQPPVSRVLYRLRHPRSGQQAETGRTVAGEVLESDTDVSRALEEYRASMGSDEARDRLVAALMAKRFSDEQFAMVRNARIEDPDAQSEAVAALDAVTADELEAGLGELLDRNPSLVESDELAQIGMSLNREVVVAVPRPRQVVRKSARQAVRRAKLSLRRPAR